MLCMSTHGARPIALVVAAIDLFGRETETGEFAEEGGCGLEEAGESGMEHDSFIGRGKGS